MSLTIELHEAALNEDVSASKLVRLALVLATKLKDAEIVSWCQKELNGYKNGDKVPEYRVLHGELYGSDEWGRKLPCTIVDNPKQQEQLMRCPFSYPVAEIEHMVQGGTKALEVSFHPRDEQHLREIFKGTTKVFRIVQIGGCRKILDAIRQHIFEWTIALQEKHLDVEGSFEEGKVTAAASPDGLEAKGSTITATNLFQIGEISSSPFQVQPVASPQTVSYEKLDIAAISRMIGALSNALAVAKHPDLDDLKSEVETIRQLLAAPKRKHSWIAEGLGSVRRILEETAGHLAAEGIKAAPYVDQITQFLGLQ